jgi:hypothetical protein
VAAPSAASRPRTRNRFMHTSSRGWGT